MREVLDRIGDKWSTLIILQLGHHGVMRFTGLSKAIGDVSQKMLTTTVRNLEADGLIARKAFPEIPPRVEYRLTVLGQSLLPLIEAMTAWADKNITSIQRNRRRNAAKTTPSRR